VKDIAPGGDSGFPTALRAAADRAEALGLRDRHLARAADDDRLQVLADVERAEALAAERVV
jgi:hypothetical protein